MGEATVVNPRGKFDRATVGRSVVPVAVEIERGRIRFFAEVLGEGAAVHRDLEAARAAGHPDLVAPPSYVMVIEADANAELKRRGERSAFDLVCCDYRYLLHGDETYEYLGPIHAGEAVTFTTRVIDFYDKKGGAMEFVTLASEIRHAERGVLVRTTRTLLHRLPDTDARA